MQRGPISLGIASPGKHGAIRGFGVDYPVDSSKGWERGLPKLDLVMDALGGPSFRRSYTLLPASGREARLLSARPPSPGGSEGVS